MNKASREVARERAENRIAAKRSRKQYKASVKAGRVQAFVNGIERHKSKRKKSALDKVQSAADSLQYKIDTKSDFWTTLNRKASKLFDDEDYLSGVLFVSTQNHVRDITEWKPKGKSKYSLFNSLCSYLIAKYPTPQFIWSAFLESECYSPECLGYFRAPNINYKYLIRDISVRIASGESFAKICKKDFPIPFTKKQCHEFLNTSAEYDFVSAVRRVQVKTHGGSNALFKVWKNFTRIQNLGNRNDELFWESVLAFFCNNPMYDTSEVPQLYDYIAYRKENDDNFSMKGRTIAALIRGMEEWHAELHRVKVFKAQNFDASGFIPGIFKDKDKNTNIENKWTIDEIRTSKELAAEGGALNHCVYSYSRSVSEGLNSIWSMKLNGERMLTIQVSNNSKSIVQYRGKHNRQPKNDEYRILLKWAEKNGLKVSTHNGW